MGSRRDAPDIRSYEDAALYLGSKETRPLYHNTRVNRRGDNIAITYHRTDIVMYQPTGEVVINTEGWHTVTTKARLNRHLPGGFGIYQEASIWYISISRDDTRGRVFYDGMVITPDGLVRAPDGQVCAFGDSGLKELNKRILKYSRDYIKALFAGEVPAPGPGDCWYCYFRAGEVKRVDSAVITTGKPPAPDSYGQPTLGEATRDDHLISHLEQKYYVPSLLVRAIEVFPVSKAATWCLAGFWGSEPDEPLHFFGEVAKQQLRSSLKRYLRRCLGLSS